MRVMEVGLAVLLSLGIFGLIFSGFSILESFAQETIEEPVEETIDEPAQETIEEPVEETIDEPAQETIEEPVEETIDEPAQETIEEPVEETIDEPAQETIEEPVEETIDEPIVQQNVQESVEEILKEPIVQQNVQESVENTIEESAVQTENEPVAEETNSKRKMIKEKIQEKLLKNELISEGSKKIQSEKRVIILYKEKMKNSGSLLITIPFGTRQETQLRAKLEEGKIKHILPAQYHSNPIAKEERTLVFYNYGWDFLDFLKKAGFSDAYMLGYYDINYGYIGNKLQSIFVAKK